MFRKIVTYTGISMVFIIFGAYFYFASMLKEKGDEKALCKVIDVTILDSTVNRFVSCKEVKGLIMSSPAKPIGLKIKDIRINDLEETLNKRSAIKKSDVSVSRDGKMYVSITQRRPLLRIEGEGGGFYIDESLYVFPLVNTFTSYVPVVTGNIPIQLKKGHRGLASGDDAKWLNTVMKFGNYISKSDFWDAQIQQIHFDSNGDVHLYTRVGDQNINFGTLDEVEKKLRKLNAYYQNIVPIYGWNRYSEINLKYEDQIVCKLKKQ
jgi:cell division protein FtsQ